MRACRLLLVIATLLACPVGASAQVRVPGTWREGDAARAFVLEGQGLAGASAQVAEPSDPLSWVRVTLEGDEPTWALLLERRCPAARGLAGRLADEQAQGDGVWRRLRRVPLTRADERALVSLDGAWRLTLPAGEQPQAAVAPVASAAATRPRVTVLLTGFDRFPRSRNHPTYVRIDAPEASRTPRVNSSGWAVRHFDPGRLSADLLRDVEVIVHTRTDLPVEYGRASQAVLDAVAALEPDVAIGFGVGADFGTADVEQTCENLRQDGSAWGQEDLGVGPFYLPADWPPAAPMSEWDAEARRWLWRYPDNAGVSYQGAPIDPVGPSVRKSTLPVARIVRRLNEAGIYAIDGGDGPGRYICNELMYTLIGAQTARDRIGGFIHLRAWSEAWQDSFLQVLALAVEESVRAWLESDAARLAQGAPQKVKATAPTKALALPASVNRP